MALLKFGVVLCRIRLFPTFISKIKWLESELPLISNLVKISPTEKKVQMKVSGGGLPDTFTVGQMHLHWAQNGQAFGNGGSEHLLNSMRFWGELHVVCFNDKYSEGHLDQPDGLAVLGFFVDVSST